MTEDVRSLANVPPAGQSKGRRQKTFAVAASIATVAVMVALTYAAVPLYRLFCQVTGFAGTTQVATAAPGAAAAPPITVRFDANVALGLPWRFIAPSGMQVRLGEERQVAYTATNLSSEPILGTAVFNVTPLQVGSYFYKIECFCFTEQLLMPGERKEFPVSFFVDPAILKDDDGRSIAEITLSYTFYSKGPAARDEYLRSHPATTAAVSKSRQ
jgi:cytochrome c oxidase assembly protein subunit 11